MRITLFMSVDSTSHSPNIVPMTRREDFKKISDRGKVLEIHLLSETSPSSSHIMENIILEIS